VHFVTFLTIAVETRPAVTFPTRLATATSPGEPPGLGPRRQDLDPVTTAVIAGFGGWFGKPFVAVVIVAFVACGLAAQGATARSVHSIARDDVLPLFGLLKRVNRRQAPSAASSPSRSPAAPACCSG